jgi:hypothetical protein
VEVDLVDGAVPVGLVAAHVVDEVDVRLGRVLELQRAFGRGRDVGQVGPVAADDDALQLVREGGARVGHAVTRHAVPGVSIAKPVSEAASVISLAG